jgi:hypothetical protein
LQVSSFVVKPLHTITVFRFVNWILQH